MALDTNIVGTNLDAGGNLKTALTNTPEYMGGVRMFSESDPGDVTGSPLLLSPEVSSDYRLRAAIDTLWDHEVFNYTAQNSSRHRYVNSTMTNAWSGGAMTSNSGSATAASNGTLFQTWRHYPIFNSSTLYADTVMALTNTGVTNFVIEFGFHLAAIASPYAATDGVFFRISPSGVQGVSVNNSVETTTAGFSFTQAVNRTYKFTISFSQNKAYFWIDDILYGSLSRPTSSGALIYSTTVPYSIRHYNTGITSAVLQAKWFSYTVSMGDFETNRLWATVAAGMGNSAVQAMSGQTAGQTANYANSAAPASATLSNTAAGYTTLGGQFQFAAVAGAETDYVLFGYQVGSTTPTIGAHGRTFVLRGIWIDTMNTGAAVATTATWLQWALGVGSSAVSLATTEAATTKAARRIALGNQVFAIADAIGKQANRIDVNLDAPITIDAGQFVQVILKMPLGTATASQIIRGIVGINGYWE